MVAPKCEIRRNHDQVPLHRCPDEGRDDAEHVRITCGLKPRRNRNEDHHIRSSPPHGLKPFQGEVNEGLRVALDDRHLLFLIPIGQVMEAGRKDAGVILHGLPSNRFLAVMDEP